MVPAMVPCADWSPGAGGTSSSAYGVMSSGPSVEADQPIPRSANTSQIASQSSSPSASTAACTIALRMSSIVGFSGARRSPSVTYWRTRSSPSAGWSATSRMRSDQSVSAQISPSAWGSGAPTILPKSS